VSRLFGGGGTGARGSVVAAVMSYTADQTAGEHEQRNEDGRQQDAGRRDAG